MLEGLRKTTIVKDLERHLAERVPELHRIHAREKRRKQVPLVIPEPGWKYDEPILSSHATEADVARLKEMAITAELDEEFEKAKQLLLQIVEFSEGRSQRSDAVAALDRIERKQNRRTIIAEAEPVNSSSTPTTPPTPQTPGAKPPDAKPTTPQSADQQSIDAIALDSEKGVDYRKLRDLLKAGQWKKADQETLLVMLKAVNRVSKDWLNSNSLKNFPCKDLKTIDQLWVTASNGHFGFSVQMKVWHECGSPTSSGKDWDHFCARVGWQRDLRYVNYSGLDFKLNLSPKGELPVMGAGSDFINCWRLGEGFGGFGIRYWWDCRNYSSLAQRLMQCRTKQF
ncbi:MAG: GUN4 domain-containing protein [Rhizonema sp. PD38]|nr:GUN4 domain-containing protein [Rhizonema sp. PD38]